MNVLCYKEIVNKENYYIENDIIDIPKKDYFLKRFNFINILDFLEIDFNKNITFATNILLTKDEEKEFFLKINNYLLLIYKNFLQIPLFFSILINFNKKSIKNLQIKSRKIKFNFFYKNNSNYCSKHNLLADKEILYINYKEIKMNYIKKYLQLNAINICIHEEIAYYILTDIEFYRVYFTLIYKDFNKIINAISLEMKKLISLFENFFNIKEEFFLDHFLNIKLNKFYLIFLKFINIKYINLKIISNDIYLIINKLIVIEKYLGIDIPNFKIIMWNIISSYINYNFYRIKIIKYNFRLILSIAKNYSSKNIHLIDLLHEGNIGLIKAIEKFDITKGYKFSTYATWWIRQSINRFLADYSRTIRLPVHIIETINKISRFSKKCDKEGKNTDINLISDKLHIPLAKLKKISLINKEPISMDVSINNDDDKSCIRDLIKDTNNSNILDKMSSLNLKTIVSNLLKHLPRRESKVLRMRFGIGYKRTFTLEEIGKGFKVTRERIRQIEKKALSKLRVPSLMKTLRYFLNTNVEDN